VLDLEASADGARDRIYWFIDSTYLGASSASSPLAWKPEVGRHVIRAVDEAGRADSRVVTVDAVE
jgi:penicillin-binding protein 1C